VNDEITHLGWSRLEVLPEDKLWSPVAVVMELLETTKVFLDELDLKPLPDRISKLKDGIENGFIVMDYFGMLGVR